MARNRKSRALAIAQAGSIDAALHQQSIEQFATVSASEALVLGLIRLNVKKFFAIFGHGNTDLGEVLRVYAEAGVVSVNEFRNEIEMSHAATALKWTTGENVAVLTSIGPGALQALSASLTASSNGVGVWHIYGDETTHDEGYNMQQVPGLGQAQFSKMVAEFGQSYLLHTPEAIAECLRRGAVTTAHPTRPQPFYVLFPINVQPQQVASLRLDRLPQPLEVEPSAAAARDIGKAAAALAGASNVVIKVGRGATGASEQVLALAEKLDAVCVMSPSSVGIIPSGHPRNMGVGGSKGSLSGNYAMEHAKTLIVVGSRMVCQSDCSRTGYPQVDSVVNINADIFDAAHYNKTVALVGDIATTIDALLGDITHSSKESAWSSECAGVKAQWLDALAVKTADVCLFDDVWGREVLTQPSAISVVLEWADNPQRKVFFDAGDVQAHGFQVANAERENWFYTDSGASYMGFAVSAVLAGGLADSPFYGVALTGDGSFVMNPQVLLDAVHTKTSGCVVVFDNRRMGAISSLQDAQYGQVFKTGDGVAVDYSAWAAAIDGVMGSGPVWSAEQLREALDQAAKRGGLTLIHVPVYFGSDPNGSIEAFGRWNVGPWVADVQRRVAEGTL